MPALASPLGPVPTTPAPTTTTPSPWLRNIAGMALLVGGVIALGVAFAAMAGGHAYRTPAWAIWIHLATVIPAVPLGAWVLWRRRKGDRLHRIAGRLWVVLMLVTAIDSFWIRTLTGTIGPIHIFSVITLWALPRAIWHARHGRIEQHLRGMRGTYIGLIVAGAFAMAPGRMLWSLVFG